MLGSSSAQVLSSKSLWMECIDAEKLLPLKMYASMHVNAALSCQYRTERSIPMQCKSLNALSSRCERLDMERLEYKGPGNQRLDFASKSQFIDRQTTSRLTCKATNAAKKKSKFSRDELTEFQLEKWQETIRYLEGLGFIEEEADKLLGKAFGWVDSPYWTETTEETVPDLQIVLSKVALLKELGLSEVELPSLLKKFPEVLGCRETLIKHNIGILDKEWGITGMTLKNIIIRNPQVLGYNVDCKGDCMAQCTRCWVRF